MSVRRVNNVDGKGIDPDFIAANGDRARIQDERALRNAPGSSFGQGAPSRCRGEGVRYLRSRDSINGPWNPYTAPTSSTQISLASASFVLLSRMIEATKRSEVVSVT